MWDLGACVNDWLRAAIRDALNPALELLSGTLLATPTLAQMPRVEELWSRSWQIMLACYATLIMAAGVLLMAHESLQTRYSLRELLPRVIVGFFAGALSLVLAGMAIDVANALSVAVMSGGTDPEAGAAALTNLILGAVTNNGGLFLLLAGAVVVIMLIALLLVYVVRVAFTVLLIAAAPIALMLHALPQTEGIAAWWWRAFGGVLAIQVLQSLVLATAVRVLLNNDGAFATTLFGTTTGSSSDGWINLLVSITLLWILFKIPFWVLGSVSGRRGRSLLGSALRTYLTFKTFGLARTATTGLLGRSAKPSRGKPPGAAGDDPYAGEHAAPDGQLMLPVPGVRRGRRRLTPAPGWPTIPRSGQGSGGRGSGSGGSEVGRQLALPLTEGDWPENRPRLGPDGQYRLPLEATRVPRPAPHPTAPPSRGRGPRPAEAGVQLGLPLADGDWPENRPRLGRDGQYRLPLEVKRVPPPRPTPAPPPPPKPRRTGEGRQQAFPFHDPQPWVFDGNRPLRSGQYPLPLPGLTRHPRTSTPTPPPPAPPAGPPPQQLPLPLEVPTPAAAPPATPPHPNARRTDARRAGARRASRGPAAAPQPATTPPDQAEPTGGRSVPRSVAEPETPHAPRLPRDPRRRSS